MSLHAPLLRTLEAPGEASPTEDAVVQHWAGKLEGCTPILQQLPTDQLGPSEQHREATTVSLTSSTKGLISPVPSEAMAHLVGGLAALLGRYSMASETVIGLWRSDLGKTGCQPLRVSLLRQPHDTTPVWPAGPVTEEEISVITPLSSFASVRCLFERIGSEAALVKDHNLLLQADGLRKLDMLTTSEATNGSLRLCRSMDAFVVLGTESIPAASCSKAPLMLVCTRWPPAPNSNSKLELRCPRGLFSPDTVGRMIRHLTALLDAMVRSPTIAICQLPLHEPTSPDEAEVSSWADAYSSSCYCPRASNPFSADRSMTSMLAATAATSPDALAMVDDGTGATYTYEEVLKMSSSIAHGLARTGVPVDSLVPLMASRSVEMILGILGIIRTGSGYVPLDLHWPDDRLQDVLRQCRSKVVLASSDCHKKLSHIALEVEVSHVLDISMNAASGGHLEDRGSGSSLVYAFFTSGTTGKPKGVMVENKGLVHRIHWFQQKWPLRQGEGVVSKVAYTFGLSEWEIFWPLVAGATLVIAPPGGEKDADYLLRRACNAFTPPHPKEDARLLPGRGPSPDLIQCMAAHVFVPSMLQMVLEKYDELEDEDLQRKAEEHHSEGTWWHHSKAREVITCGEALSPALAQKMFSRFHCTLTNLYGPTEGEMSYWDVPQGRALLRVSAGRPMEGCKVVLTDLRDQKPAGSLEPAEIAFGGPFIARGYLGRPDLDAQAFVPDFTATPHKSSFSGLNITEEISNAPLLGKSVSNGSNGSDPAQKQNDRLYMTGDLGRWRAGGVVDLLGRKDFQVKLRGFRIELGEIEAACRAAGARASVCLVKKSSNGTQALVAYYEPGPDQDVPEAAVRKSCQKSLPPYMQPQSIVQMEKLPRNTNGKIDRKMLPEPPAIVVNQTEEAMPETPVQKSTAAAIAAVLGLPVETVQLDSDFQEMGGNSLLMGRASSAIKKAFGLSTFKGTTVYQLGTVRRIAAAVENLLAQETDAGQLQSEPSGALALQPQRSPYSSTSASSVCIQAISVFCMNFLFQSQAWSPIWWAAWFIYEYYGRTMLFLYLPFAALLDLVMMFSAVVLLKWLIVGRVKPGTMNLWSAEYYRWWFVNTLLSHTLKLAMPLVADTSIASSVLRALGAKVGEGAKIGVFSVHDPDLLEIGAYATIGKKAKLATSSVLHGSVHLGSIRIGDRAAVGPTAVLAQDTVVPAGKAVLPLSTMPGWHGSVGSVAFRDAQPPRTSETFDRRQNLLRLFFGMPVVLLAEVIPYYLTYFVLVWTYDGLYAENKYTAFAIWSVLLSWIYAHPMWFFRLAVVILQKRLLIGDFRKQQQEINHWTEWKHWVHARAVESHDFEEACEMFTNTEMLSYIYRALGTKVGKRVQIDQLSFVENDCVTIDDYVVFGSEVMMYTDTQAPWVPEEYNKKLQKSRGLLRRYADIHICQAANVLDHCSLLPGVAVAERAVLGTCTLASAGSYYPPLAIHSGSQRGRSMHLRDSFSSPAMRALEDKTMQDLDSPVTWWRFNLVILLVILIANPLPEAAWVATYFGVTSIWDVDSGSVLTLLIVTPFVYNFIEFILLLANIALKWIIIGKYIAGEYKFFGSYHMRWMIMMICGSGISALQDCLQGTIFEVWLARACGAKVGKECYLAGLMVEYDLLTIGDHVSIGSGCDTTGHTVENMVIKLAPTRIGDGAALLPGSFAMPGSVVEDEAVLMEHTQVLKGETVPAREVWAGMPASGCQPTAGTGSRS